MDTIGKTAWSVVNYVFIIIDGSIFGLVNAMYKVYMALAGARIFQNELFIGIADRIYAVVGVVMLFMLAYSIIQGIISPDKFVKGSSSNGAQLIKKILIAVLGVALVPSVFNLAYRAQDAILENDIIGKIFLGYDNKSNKIYFDDITVNDEVVVQSGNVNQNDAIKSNGGTVAAVVLWQAFFYPTDTESKTAADEIEAKEAVELLKGPRKVASSLCGVALLASGFFAQVLTLPIAAACGVIFVAGKISDAVATALVGKTLTLNGAYNVAASSGDFGVFAPFSGNVASGEITFHFILAFVAGIACLYLFFSFALDMAVRAAKLSYLEIIAPVPLMLQIVNKNGNDSFKKWYTKCLSLFFEVFIRLSLVYVIVYLIAHLQAILSTMWNSAALKGSNIVDDFLLNAVLKICLILGLLMFAKEAPKFVVDTLGINAKLEGGLGIGVRSKLDRGGVFQTAALAGGVGANLASGVARGFGNFANAFNRNNGLSGSERTRAAISGLASGITSGFGQALRAAPRTYRDSRNAHDLRSMATIVGDSMAAGQNMEARRQAARDRRNAEIERNYNAELQSFQGGDETRQPGFLRRLGMAAGARMETLRDDMQTGGSRIWNNLSNLPEDTTYSSGRDKAAKALQGVKKTVNDLLAIHDKGVKAAQRDVDYYKSSDYINALRTKLLTENPGMTEEELQSRIRSEQTSMIASAEDRLDKERARGLRDSIAKGLMGKPDDVYTALTNAVLENHSLFQEHANDRIDASGKTLGEAVSELFGGSAISGAELDGGVALTAGAGAGQSMEIKVGGKEGQASIKVKRTGDARSGYKAQYSYTDGSGHEHSFDTLQQAARAAVGEDATVLATRTLKEFSKAATDASRELLDDLIAGRGIGSGAESSLTYGGRTVTAKRGSDGKLTFSIDGTSSSEADLRSLAASSTLAVDAAYIDSLSKASVAAGMTSDFRLELKTGDDRTCYAGFEDGQYYFIGPDGSRVSCTTAADLAAHTASLALAKQIQLGEDKDTVATASKTTGSDAEHFITSSDERRNAVLHARQSDNRGGNH